MSAFLGQSPFENLPRDLRGDGLSVSSPHVLSPTLLVSLLVSASLHWNFFTRIRVVKCFTNCSKIFICESMLQNEHVCVCVCVCGGGTYYQSQNHCALGSQPNKIETARVKLCCMTEQTLEESITERGGQSLIYFLRYYTIVMYDRVWGAG
jgi:hypothetical protein